MKQEAAADAKDADIVAVQRHKQAGWSRTTDVCLEKGGMNVCMFVSSPFPHCSVLVLLYISNDCCTGGKRADLTATKIKMPRGVPLDEDMPPKNMGCKDGYQQTPGTLADTTLFSAQ